MLFYYRDNRNIGSKKSDYKENVTTNAMGRTMSSSVNQESKEAIQSARTDMTLDDKASSVAVAQRDSITTALSPNLDKDCPSEAVSGLTTAQLSTPKKDHPFGLSSRPPPLKDSLKTVSVASQEDGDCMPQQDLSGPGSVELQNTVNTSNVILVKCGSDRNFKDGAEYGAGKDSSISVGELPAGRAHMSPMKNLDEVVAKSSNCCTLQESSGNMLVKEDLGKVYLY